MGHDFEQRPDPLWKEHVGRSRGQAGLIVVGVIAAYVAIMVVHSQGVCSLPGAAPAVVGR